MKLDVLLSYLPTLLTFRSGGREMGKELSHSGASSRHLQSSSFMFPLITHLSCQFHGAVTQNRTEEKTQGRGTLQCLLLGCQSLQFRPAVLPLGQTQTGGSKDASARQHLLPSEAHLLTYPPPPNPSKCERRTVMPDLSSHITQ